MQSAAAAAKITPFLAMEVAEAAEALRREGHDVISFALGEPDFDTPACVREAAERALRDGHTHYTHSLGIVELREAICEHYFSRYGVSLTPDRVMVTAGTSPALMLVFCALLEPGDEVVLTNPCYACYPNFVRFANGEVVLVNTDAADGYQLDAERVRAALGPRTKAVLINSPANPTGAVLGATSLKGLADLGPTIVSDEIYHGLVYEGEEHTILEYTDRAIVLNGFSKLYAMTGWRLGYIIAPTDVIRRLQVLYQNFFISAAAFVQWAAIAALREAGPDVERMRQTYAERRRFMLAELGRLGFRIPSPPTGAFYVLADARHYGEDSLRLAYEILHGAKVAVTPGVDFGTNAEGHLRFSYATDIANIAEGMERLERYLAQRR